MSFIGRDLEAITLNASLDQAGRRRTPALTENFLPVQIDGTLAANRLVRVRVTGLTDEGALKGALASR
jgi:hypothetical protein